MTNEIVQRIEDRFVSGNEIPVERAHITRAEWQAVRHLILLTSAVEGPREQPCSCVDFCRIHGQYGGILAAGVYCAAKRNLSKVSP